MSSKLPFHVRATDVVHRVTVLGLVGICVVGVGSISFNLWANSDYSPFNKKKLTFQKDQYDELRTKDE
jgi:hypothetical protein